MLPFAILSSILGLDKKKITGWLTNKLTYEEAEKIIQEINIVLSKKKEGLTCNLPKVFKEGDEYWKYQSPPETWEKLKGRSGICLVRNGKVIDYEVMSMN